MINNLNNEVTFKVARLSGIYVIINKVTNRFYIGESLSIKQRWLQHSQDLEAHVHNNINLQEDYLKYGKNNFEYKLLLPHYSLTTIQTKAELIILEHAYINRYKNKYKLYNIEDTMHEFLMSNEYGDYSPDGNLIIKKTIIDVLLNYRVEWIEETPYMVKNITVCDLLKNTRSHSQEKINRLIGKMPDSIKPFVDIRTIQYIYNDEMKEKKSIVVKEIAPVMEWLSSIRYKPQFNANEIYGL